MAPFDYSFQSDTMVLSPATYDALYYGTSANYNAFQFFESYREIPPLWSDTKGRDRFHLARARFFYPTPLSTPTLDVRPAYVVRSRRLSGWLRKAERSPLNKRALSRR